MKTPSLALVAGLAALMMSGCGQYEKNPVQDLQKLREQGKNEINKGPERPQVITETVVVERPVEVIKEQTTVNESFFVVSADDEMNFTEGQASSFAVVGRSLVEGVKIRLEAQGLPEGATFQAAPTAQEKDRYLLTWKPNYNTVPYGKVLKSYKFKLLVRITDVPANQDRKLLEALTPQTEAKLLVTKTQEAPTIVEATIPDSVQEGSVTPFQITVRIPGVDNRSAEEPEEPRITYDRLAISQGNALRELDGARHVVPDPQNLRPQYLGDYRWKFHWVFDTKNIPVLPPQNIKGDVVANADVAPTRMSVKAFSPYGTSTPKTLKKVQIILAKPAGVQ